MRTILQAAAVLTLVGAASSEVQATPQPITCGYRADITRSLDRYSEKPLRWQLDMDGSVYEFWAAPSGSWSFLRTTPNGISCVLDVGRGADVPEPPRPEPWLNPLPKLSA